MKYLCIYEKDYSYEVFSSEKNSWRELQQEFDPNYVYNDPRFFPIGEEVN